MDKTPIKKKHYKIDKWTLFFTDFRINKEYN